VVCHDGGFVIPTVVESPFQSTKAVFI
jgi:hypothetical protein